MIKKKRNSVKKMVLLLFLCISMMLCFTPVFGADTLEQKNINIVFVVDCSNSMNFNDKIT